MRHSVLARALPIPSASTVIASGELHFVFALQALELSTMIYRFRRWLDTLGAITSWLCAVHCLVLPLMIGVLPLVGAGFLLNESVERGFIGFSVFVASASLLPAYIREHRKAQTILLAASGLGLIVLTHFTLEDKPILRFVFLSLGAILVSSAHLINQRLCRDCAASSKE